MALKENPVRNQRHRNQVLLGRLFPLFLSLVWEKME